VIDKNDPPMALWALEHWGAVIMLAGSLVLFVVLALVAQWWGKRDVEAQEVNYAAGARR